MTLAFELIAATADLAISCSKQRGCRKERVRVVPQKHVRGTKEAPELGGLRRLSPEEVPNREPEIASHEVVKCSLVVKLVEKKEKTKEETN